jgi:hypothetical protein
MKHRRHLTSKYRSGLEGKVAEQFTAVGRDPHYEEDTIRYTKPVSLHRYKPDFRLRKNVYVETKGMLDVDDRKKHLLIQAQHPDIEIRFVFSRSAAPIRKGSPTTYADWCNANGFVFADKRIPEEWFHENE